MGRKQAPERIYFITVRDGKKQAELEREDEPLFATDSSSAGRISSSVKFPVRSAAKKKSPARSSARSGIKAKTPARSPSSSVLSPLSTLRSSSSSVRFSPRLAQKRSDRASCQAPLANMDKEDDAEERRLKRRLSNSESTPAKLGVDGAAAACWPTPPFSTELVGRFHRLLLQVQAEHNLPASFVESVSVLQLLDAINPALRNHIPNRNGLGGWILEKFAKECADMERKNLLNIHKATGGRINVSCGGWANISMKHIMVCQLALFGYIHTKKLIDPGTRPNAIVLATILDRVITKAINKGMNIGAVITDDACQCAKARRILAKRWPRIVFLRCFAHDVNHLLKDALKGNFENIVRQASTAVNFINASLSTWLVHAKNAMERWYNKAFTLHTLCETRWNSIQACFASLLRVRGSLRSLAQAVASTRRNDKNDELPKELPVELSVFLDDDFWSSLAQAERVIRPLSNASYRLQRDENTLADVVISFRDIYYAFAGHNTPGHSLAECVEKRWAKCEQPLFLLGYFLHPAHRADVDKLLMYHPTLNFQVATFANYYYRRLLDGENDTSTMSEFQRWLDTDISQYSAASSRDYWRLVRGFWPWISKLAIVVLSIAVNSASCERLFSDAIHSPSKNGLEAEKSRQLYLVKKRLLDEVAASNEEAKMKKKKMRILCPDERQTVLSNEIDRDECTSDDEEMESEILREHEDAVTRAKPQYSSGDSFLFWQSTLEKNFEDEDVAVGYDRAGGFTLDPLESIPEPDMRPFSKEDMAQENKVTGLRAWSIPLAELFPLSLGPGRSDHSQFT